MIDTITGHPITLSDLRAELALVERDLRDAERHGAALVWQLALVQRRRLIRERLIAWPTRIEG